jgi:hypothetical protein
LGDIPDFLGFLINFYFNAGALSGSNTHPKFLGILEQPPRLSRRVL